MLNGLEIGVRIVLCLSIIFALVMVIATFDPSLLMR